MNRDERNMEDCRATWREEARSRAAKEAEELAFQASEREAFIRDREAKIYAELEKIGTEGL